MGSIDAQAMQGPGRGGDNIQVFAEWEDEVNVTNFYRLRPFVNDSLRAAVYSLVTDQFSDGDMMKIPVQERFEAGQKVKIQLLSCDEAYYRYFLELSSVVGDGFNSSNPYNPVANFDNDALGYFGIFSVSEMEVQL